MKVRMDFVTNSSSSSFILAFKDKDNATAAIIDSLKYNPEALGYVLRDITEAQPLSEKQLQERLQDEAESYAYMKMHYGDGGWWSSRKPTFENEFLKNHPDYDCWTMQKHPDYIAEKKRLMDVYITDIRKKLEGKPYVVEIEYSDNDGTLFSELEHYIMPHVNGVVAVCNHH